MIELHLNWPPTVNNYYVKTKRGIFISKKGREFREGIIAAVNEQASGVFLQDPISCTVILSPPDKRVRDLDNYMKALLDAITHSGLWEDDSLIDQLFIYRGKQSTSGKVIMRIDAAGPVMSPEHLLRIV